MGNRLFFLDHCDSSKMRSHFITQNYRQEQKTMILSYLTSNITTTGGIQLTQIISIISCMIALIALWRNFHADNNANVGQMTEIAIKLENISNNTLEIKNEIKTVKQDIEKLRERVIIVEQSAKSAHKRIDGIKDEHQAD